MAERPLCIGVLAGEASGDQLGAGLMAALRARYPDSTFVGVGGPAMTSEGLASWVPMETLSVMGLVEPLKRLPMLLRLRRQLIQRFQATRPDVFVGIDSPDFNLGVERALRRAGIRTAHYVSPTVWAWRRGRLRKIARAVDLMLTLFPFETDVYEAHGIPVRFVGHPLADRLQNGVSRETARKALNCDTDHTLVALLPGSRAGEIRQMGALFLETAIRCLEQQPALRFMVPAASPERLRELEALMAPYRERLEALSRGADSPIWLVDGQSQLAMTAADAVLMASGTTTLEAMLLRRPMVVAYRMAPLSYRIISRLLKTPYIALPNLLAGRRLVPEVLQDEATPERLSRELLALLAAPDGNAALRAEFGRLHDRLSRGASEQAADAVAQLARDHV